MTYRTPAEWTEHERVWIGFPWDEREWPDMLARAQRQIADFANGVHDAGDGEKVHLVTGSEDAADRAQSLVEDGITVEHRKIGDCWLRDTGCIIVSDGQRRIARNFRFNGWGGRYLMAGDQSIGSELAEDMSLEVTDCDWILEGGAIDVDGQGLAITTEDCLLNPNRNPDMTREDIEAALLCDLGIEKLLWLGDGLKHDHTDGHIDNLARFVAAGHLVIAEASGASDPNAAVYADAHARAEAFRCKVTPFPSPGRIVQNGAVMSASYLNFYIGNNVVIAPQYAAASDDKAISALETLFPDRKVIGIATDAILAGGGSFHCCAQQLPA